MARIRAYSAAEAPDSFRKNYFRKVFMALVPVSGHRRDAGGRLSASKTPAQRRWPRIKD